MAIIHDDGGVTFTAGQIYLQRMMINDDWFCDGRTPQDPLSAIFHARMKEYDAAIGEAVVELTEVIEWLRETKNYPQSDRVRTIAGRLARARRWRADEADNLIRTVARGWT